MSHLTHTMGSSPTTLPTHSNINIINNNNSDSRSISRQPTAWELPSTLSYPTPRLRAAASTAPCGRHSLPARLPGLCPCWWGLRYISTPRRQPALACFPLGPHQQQGRSSVGRRPLFPCPQLTTENRITQVNTTL